MHNTGQDGTVHIWDLGSGSVVREFRGHTSALSAICCSSDGTLLATAGYDKSLRVWNLSSAGYMHLAHRSKFKSLYLCRPSFPPAVLLIQSSSQLFPFPTRLLSASNSHIATVSRLSLLAHMTRKHSHNVNLPQSHRHLDNQ